MQTKIQKWGTSLGLQILRSFATEAEFEEGSIVDLTGGPRSVVSTGGICPRSR